MLSPAVHARRRFSLGKRVRAPVLLSGNGVRARNLPMNALPFRQDSTFLYFTGCEIPRATALIHEGHCTLFLPRPASDDPLWHGEVPTFEDLRERYGVDAVRGNDELGDALRNIRPLTLAVADEERNLSTAGLLGRPLRFGADHGDPELALAVIALRREKGPEELEEMRSVARATARAFRAVMAGTRPGGHERQLHALFEGILATEACTTGYDTILTQKGDVLHQHAHGSPLEAGRLLLLDGGGELESTGYGCDITRTWPVSGQFSPRQRSAYDAVLDAQKAAIARCRSGVRYREVHDAACLEIARFLTDERLLRVAPDLAVEAGAHAIFFPHGVGHLLGLDVHDLENFGDLAAYSPGAKRSTQFGTCYLRLDLPLEPGWVVTVEPGFYVVPAILADQELRDRFRRLVDFDRAVDWLGFGGIRIEDDIAITTGEPDILTHDTPKEVALLEELIGLGPTPEERFA